MIRNGLFSIATLLSLTVASPVLAQATAPAATAMPAATPAGADAFVAQAQKELADYSLDASRTAWVNATYITDDTDALAAKSGAIGTEMAVRFALGGRVTMR